MFFPQNYKIQMNKKFQELKIKDGMGFLKGEKSTDHHKKCLFSTADRRELAGPVRRVSLGMHEGCTHAQRCSA